MNQQDPPVLQNGHSSGPISSARLAVLILVGAEIMFFAGLIGTFLVFRVGSMTWPPPTQSEVRLPIVITGVNTVILLLSGYTMFKAVRRIPKNGHKELGYWLLLTGLLGGVFLLVQGSEWIRLVRHGFTLSSGIYGSVFYVLIGCHAAHVLIAVLWLLVVFSRVKTGRHLADSFLGVDVCAIYWIFVVTLWPVLYVLVYLI